QCGSAGWASLLLRVAACEFVVMPGGPIQVEFGDGAGCSSQLISAPPQAALARSRLAICPRARPKHRGKKSWWCPLFLPLFAQSHHRAVHDADIPVDAHVQVLEVFGALLARRMAAHEAELFVLGNDPGWNYVQEIGGKNRFQRSGIAFHLKPVILQ